MEENKIFNDIIGKSYVEKIIDTVRGNVRELMDDYNRIGRSGKLSQVDRYYQISVLKDVEFIWISLNPVYYVSKNDIRNDNIHNIKSDLNMGEAKSYEVNPEMSLKLPFKTVVLYSWYRDNELDKEIIRYEGFDHVIYIKDK